MLSQSPVPAGATQTCETISQALYKVPALCTIDELCLIWELPAEKVTQCLPHHVLLVLDSDGVQAHVWVSFPSA